MELYRSLALPSLASCALTGIGAVKGFAQLREHLRVKHLLQTRHGLFCFRLLRSTCHVSGVSDFAPNSSRCRFTYSSKAATATRATDCCL